MTLSETLAIFLGGFALLFLVAFLSYCLGRLFTLQRQATQVSHFAFIAAFHAASEARSIRNGTVIQRIVEKYNLVSDKEENTQAAKDFERELEEAITDFKATQKTKRKTNNVTFNPDELV